MQYSKVISEIIKASNTGFNETSEVRAKQKFIDAMCSLIEKKEYTINDLPDLIYEEEVLLGASGILQITGVINDLTGDPNIIDVFDIYEDPDSLNKAGYSYIPKELKDIKLISGNAEFEPGDKEIYYYRVGMYLKFYKKSEASGKYASLILVKSPATWIDAAEMVGLYSKPFLNKCIALAGAMLKSEVEEESGFAKASGDKA